MGAAQVPSDEILFFCDVDMLVEYGFYSRCRDHAREGSQAYFPIVYSMYPGAAEVGQNQGRWRTQGYVEHLQPLSFRCFPKLCLFVDCSR